MTLPQELIYNVNQHTVLYKIYVTLLDDSDGALMRACGLVVDTFCAPFLFFSISLYCRTKAKVSEVPFFVAESSLRNLQLALKCIISVEANI